MVEMVVVLNYGKAGGMVARMNRANGRILARWNGHLQKWRLEPKALREGYEDEAWTAAHCAAYAMGLTDFCPALAPELGIVIDNRW